MPKFIVAYWRDERLLMTVTTHGAHQGAVQRDADARLQKLPRASRELHMTVHPYHVRKPSPPAGGEDYHLAE